MQTNFMQMYRGFLGSANRCDESGVYWGKIVNIIDLVTYESETEDGLQKSFIEAVDDYIDTCEKLGVNRSMEKLTIKAKLVIDASEIKKLLEEVVTELRACKRCAIEDAKISSTIESAGVIHAKGMSRLIFIENGFLVQGEDGEVKVIIGKITDTIKSDGVIFGNNCQPQMEFTDDFMIIKSADGKRSIKIPLDL